MAADQVQFPTQLVEQHAASVEQVSDAMQTARSAVHDVTMDTGAYGQLCQFLPAILSPVFGSGLDALHGTVEALHETAAKLRTTAASTHGTDVASGDRITKAGNGDRPTVELPL
jgi:hypothetical protein